MLVRFVSRPGIVLLFMTVVALSGTAFGAHPLITDDAWTQGKGKFQIEFNQEYGWEKETDGGVTTRERGAELEWVLSYGIVDSVDLVLALPYSWTRVDEGGEVLKNRGIGDLTFEVKWRFYECGGFNLAVKPGIAFPTGNENDGEGTGKVGATGFLIATQELEPFSFHVNLGYMRNENDFGEERDLWHASIAAEWEVVKDLSWVANLGLEGNPDPDDDTPPAFAITGLIYSIYENLDVDAGVKFGLTDPETDIAVMTGIAFRF